MSSLGDLFNLALPTADLISDFVIVSPIPYTGFTPLTFENGKDYPLITRKILFQIIGEEEGNVQSEITDHFVETNVALQDHIALKPRTFTVSGYVGELNNAPPDAILPLKLIADKLTTLTAYTPSLTAGALRAYNKAERIYNIADKAVKAYGKVVGKIVPTEQTKIFNELMDNWKARTLFNVHTPWGEFRKAAILSMRTVQNDGDRNSSNFTIVFKEINFAETEITEKKRVSKKLRSGGPVNKGTN